MSQKKNDHFAGTPRHRIRNFKKLLILAYRNLFRNSRRTFFAVLISTSGCAAICVAIGYYSFSIYSIQELSIRNGFGGSSGSGHLQIQDSRLGDFPERSSLEFGIDSVESLIAKIMQDSDIDYALPRIEFGGLLASGDKSVPFKGFGISIDQEMKLWGGLAAINPRLHLGEQLLPLRNAKAGIIIGKTLAKSLQAKIGDMLLIYSTTVDGNVNASDVQLQGIMSTGVSETDKYYLLTNIGLAQNLLRTNKISLLPVMFKDINQLDQKTKRLHQILMPSGNPENFKLIPWNQDAAFYKSIRDIFNIIFSFMGSIILIIVLLSCWNIMNMTTMERIREIGTLRAIGLSRRNISAIFFLEALLIGFIGVILGIALQFIISRVINALRIIMPPVPGMSRPYTLQVYAFTWFHPAIALGIIAALTLSSLSAWIVIKKFSIVESIEHT